VNNSAVNNNDPHSAAPAWLDSAAAWLTPRRLRAHAAILALCLWGVCAVDFATPRMFDRAGNLKFQDFLPLYMSARMVAQERPKSIYNQHVMAEEMRMSMGRAVNARLPNLYGPQVALFFLPLSRFTFPTAARGWVMLSLLIYFGCVFVVLKTCPELAPYSETIIIATIAFPPLFHFFVRGQLSALVLACFTAAYLAFRADRNWLGGIALGLLVFKPQFLVAMPLIFLLARSWKPFFGILASAAAQLTLTWIYFDPAVMRVYFETLFHASRWIADAELSLAPIQMHSLRSFWTLLVPWPEIALPLYLLSSIAVIAIAAAVWRSASSLALRFSALTLAAVLVNPHLFVYDLLALAPVFLVLSGWVLTHASSAIRLLLYLAFILPLLGPLSRWTHFQLSVPVFVALLWALWRLSASDNFETASHKLASNDSRVV
jgi:alpha-1,2-mannosyltransferase